jgi:hypothetical protein
MAAALHGMMILRKVPGFPHFKLFQQKRQAKNILTSALKLKAHKES